jgi:hypothetical protein
MPIQIWIRIIPQVLTWENQKFFKHVVYSIANVHCFLFLVCVMGVIIINILVGQLIEIFRKKYNSALHLVEIPTDPDRHALDADRVLVRHMTAIRIQPRLLN